MRRDDHGVQAEQGLSAHQPLTLAGSYDDFSILPPVKSNFGVYSLKTASPLS
jgi:hypothetical protein